MSAVHRIAAAVPPHVATAVVLLSAAGVSVFFGVVRSGRPFCREVPAILFVAAGAVCFWLLPLVGTPPVACWGSGFVAAGALLWHWILHRREWASLWEGPSTWTRSTRLYAIAAVLLAAVLLFGDLGHYAGILVGWEVTVARGFKDAILNREGVLQYLGREFVWGHGTLSGGHASLFYGVPTFALLNYADFSPWTLRAAAASATVAAGALIGRLGGRFFAPHIGAALALLLVLDPAVLFYGRYGGSPAGTLLAVLVAVYCTWSFLAEPRSGWWMGPLAAASLFVATLQYAPARLVVLVLIATILFSVLRQWRQLCWQRIIGLLLMLVIGSAIARYESAQGGWWQFLHGRGEQIFAFRDNPQSIHQSLGRRLPSDPKDVKEMTADATCELLHLVLATTIPQYIELLRPRIDYPVGGVIFSIDPPPLPLYYPPLILFIVLGLVYSLARLPAAPHLSLLLWFIGTTVALLLTNRVDAHRGFLLVVPLMMWAAFGIAEGARVMRQVRVPVSVQHLFAAALAGTVLCGDVHLLHGDREHVGQPYAATLLGNEIAHIERPVLVGWVWNDKETTLTEIAMVDRMRRQPGWQGGMLPEGLLNAIVDPTEGLTEAVLHQTKGLADSSVILLAPAARFRRIAAALAEVGLQVTERGTDAFRFVRVERASAENP